MCTPYKPEFMVIWNYPVNKHLSWSWHNFITFRHHLRSDLHIAWYTHRHLGARVIDEDHLRFLSVKQNRHRLLSELVICGTKRERETWADGPVFCIACLAGTACTRNSSLPKVNTALKTACVFGRNNFSRTRCKGSIDTCLHVSVAKTSNVCGTDGRVQNMKCNQQQDIYCIILRCVVLCYMLCYVVLCCVVLCYVVLCYVVLLRCVMLCYVMLCCVVLCYMLFYMLCCVMLCCVMLCCVMLCCVVMLCYVMLCCVVLCYMLRYMLCYMLRYIILYYIILYYIILYYIILYYIIYHNRRKNRTLLLSLEVPKT